MFTALARQAISPGHIYRLIWLACAAPIGFVICWAINDQLGANPINTGLRYLGVWGLRFLVIGLALRPARDLFGWSWTMRYRRTIGLFALTYIGLHVSTYIGLDQFFDMAAIWADVVKRPYITLGMLGFLLLIPLGITSTNGMIKRLGPKSWRRLHWLVYLIVPLGVLHYDLLVKSDATWPRFYAALTLILLGARVWLWWRKSNARRPARRAQMV